ncbi:MAG: exonuclease domain-containing protein [Actinomycetota bacterium]|nr:exonuclease domain-containing protein [Actinomycetota bacterium]
MSTWADGPMVAFDLETTGPDPETARIVTASTVHIHPGDQPSTYDVLVNPGIDIPAEATAVHGVTTEQAREHGVDPVEVVRWLSAYLADLAEAGTPIVIYNAPFDLGVLDRECRRHGVPTLHERCATEGLSLFIVDPLTLDRALDQYRRGSRKLVDVARHYGVALSEEDAHTSSGDCLAAARVAWKIARAYPVVGEMDRDALMAYQAAKYSAWAAGFEQYLTRQGKPEPIAREWPIRAHAAVANV